jgi:hypothetical protein
MVEYGSQGTGKTLVKTVVVPQEGIAKDISHEPWTLDQISYLFQVRNYNRVTVGDGARLQKKKKA